MDPLRGSSGLAGEIGHTQLSGIQGPWCRRGHRGCLATLVFASLVHDLRRESPLSGGDSVFLLRDALADVCNWLNPSGIILGGEPDHLEPPRPC